MAKYIGRFELFKSNDRHKDFLSAIIKKVELLKMPEYVRLSQSRKRLGNHFVVRYIIPT